MIALYWWHLLIIMWLVSGWTLAIVGLTWHTLRRATLQQTEPQYQIIEGEEAAQIIQGFAEEQANEVEEEPDEE